MAYKDDIVNYLKSLIEEGLPSDIAKGGIGRIYQQVDEIGEDISSHTAQLLDTLAPVSLPPLGNAIYGRFDEVKRGIYNGLPATVIKLDISFLQPLRESLSTAYIYVWFLASAGDGTPVNVALYSAGTFTLRDLVGKKFQ